MRELFQTTCSIVIVLAGIIRIVNMRAYSICYKKYLGPDWRPEWDGATTIVSNHPNKWLDLLFACSDYCPVIIHNKSKYPKWIMEILKVIGHLEDEKWLLEK